MKFKGELQFKPNQELVLDVKENFLGMYNIPGIEPVTNDDFNKYLESKERVIDNLPDLIRKGTGVALIFNKNLKCF